MSKYFLPILVAALPVVAGAAQLTETESRWLQAGGPVLAYAKQLRLPIDIIVQPQAAPGAVPLAMGFDGGRCKLVLSMRGNPAAEDVLDTVPEARRALMIEAMTAHEVGHCWRYAQGIWHAVPKGFQEPAIDAAVPAEIVKLTQELRDTRREEGYADLAALAWTQRHHPGEYGHVYQWLSSVRAAQPSTHVSHDTANWLGLAADGKSFAGNGTPFEQARVLWDKGMLSAD